MKTKRERFGGRSNERGNALIYVLIAIALFAALSMVFTRNQNTTESGTLSDENAGLIASQLMAYASQTKSALDQMGFSGTRIDDFSFIQPTDPAFETEPPANIHKVYHPSGGGLIPGRIPDQGLDSAPGSDPAPGWYLGRINNFDWTATAANDVVLVAYQISETLCQKINNTLTGAETIPVMTETIPNTMIDTALHSGGANEAIFTTDGSGFCPDCGGVAALCVEDSAGDYGFYSLVSPH